MEAWVVVDYAPVRNRLIERLVDRALVRPHQSRAHLRVLVLEPRQLRCHHMQRAALRNVEQFVAENLPVVLGQIAHRSLTRCLNSPFFPARLVAQAHPLGDFPQSIWVLPTATARPMRAAIRPVFLSFPSCPPLPARPLAA